MNTFEFINNKPELTIDLHSVGVIKNHNGFKSFFSALQTIHVYNLHDGSYRAICSNCYNKFYNINLYNQSKCDHHSIYNIYYCCTGNPINHFSINDIKKLIANISIQRGYRTRSRQPILPSDVKDFHNYVKVLNFGIQPLSYYAILLFSIKYGLRNTGFSQSRF